MKQVDIYRAWDVLGRDLIASMQKLDPEVVEWLAENAEPTSWFRGAAMIALNDKKE